MAAVYSPWMASSDEGITDGGLATPEYAEMYAEAQAGSGSEASVEMEDSSEGDAATGEESQSGMHSAMQMALQTINQQSSVIQSLMEQLKG